MVGGESSQSLLVKLRAAELSSAEAEPALCSLEWVAEGSLELSAELIRGPGLSSGITHIPGVNTGAFPIILLIPLRETPHFWMWAQAGASESKGRRCPVHSAMRLYFARRCQFNKTNLSSTPRI